MALLVLLGFASIPALAWAAHRPSGAQRRGINAAIHRYAKTGDVTRVHIHSVRVSSYGPYAEARLGSSAGPAQFELHRRGRRWHVVAVTTQEAPACGTPARVVSDLHLGESTGHSCTA